ncbi:hypothetical protein PsYK624_021470 [Phanerochaete sordida]|uniref:Elongator complex protein 5 n=1 Tax=Phanerochaete sordida TaxID=48140 RepID=A0A9P3L9T5_9APHY|nr:hypothetical protein PsYK624_021470 [Phanerochaete sordida]
MSLEAILRGSSSSPTSFVAFQSSAAQSSLPLLRSLLAQTRSRVVLCNVLYPLRVLVDEVPGERVDIIDCTADIPGYSDHGGDCRERLLSAVRVVEPSQPLTVVIDSLDTLLANLHSKAAVHAFLSAIMSVISTRPSSRLVVHALAPSALPVLAYLIPPAFSSSLVHITAHTPALLVHLAHSLSTPPPPLSPPEKFWNVFLPIASRPFDVEELAFGNAGEGSGASNEVVVEVLVRGDSGDNTGRRRKGVERTLEGWVASKAAACELNDLPSLRSIYTGKSPSVESATTPDPTHNMSFNLTLTAEQQQSRTQVPLPYAHTGGAAPAAQTSAILYDPDSADDIDDDDPDEDLDI